MAQKCARSYQTWHNNCGDIQSTHLWFRFFWATFNNFFDCWIELLKQRQPIFSIDRILKPKYELGKQNVHLSWGSLSKRFGRRQLDQLTCFFFTLDASQGHNRDNVTYLGQLDLLFVRELLRERISLLFWLRWKQIFWSGLLCVNQKR